MSTALERPEPRDFVAIAATSTEMEAAQSRLIESMKAKRAAVLAECDELDLNLAHAVKYKLKQSGIISKLNKLKRRADFYQKLQAALEAGYTIIPDMDAQVFAIRTTRKNPTGRETSKGYVPTLADQETNRPPLGAGANVSNRSFAEYEQHELTDKDQKPYTLHVVRATEWDPEIDFPFALAKPQILEMTTRAMALKVFDDMGVLPNRANTDPVVVGRIILREGYQTKRINFLVCWFLDTRVL